MAILKLEKMKKKNRTYRGIKCGHILTGHGLITKLSAQMKKNSLKPWMCIYTHNWVCYRSEYELAWHLKREDESENSLLLKKMSSKYLQHSLIYFSQISLAETCVCGHT